MSELAPGDQATGEELASERSLDPMGMTRGSGIATPTVGPSLSKPVAHGLGSAPAPPLRPAWRRRYVIVVVCADVLGMVIGWFAAELIRFGSLGERVVGHDAISYSLLGAIAALAWPVGNALAGGYDSRVVGLSTEEFGRVCMAALRFVAVVAVLAFVFGADLSRGVVALAASLAGVLTLAFRHGLRVWLHRQRLKGRFTKGVVVVGSVGATKALAQHLQRSPVAEMRVVGACVPPEQGAADLALLGVPVLGGPTDVWTAALSVGAETIAIADPATLSAGAVKELAWHLEDHGIEVMAVPAITDVTGPRITVRLAAGLPLLYLDEPHLSLGGRFLKSAFDRFVAAVGLVILAPILLLIGLGVRLSSSGPALFKQVRVGVSGRRFRMWKFRTMVVDAEELLPDLSALNRHDGLLFKIPDDPRITRFGRWLRRWSLDEFPQLWNVVRGQMSIVGPRPPLPSEVERYDMRVRRRLRVKPGITGLWQVSGRSNLSWEEGIQLDLHYIENWSLATDLVIILKTAKSVALRQGAC